MKKSVLKAVTIASVVAMAMIIALPVQAKAKADKAAKDHEFTGVISSVDATANTVAVTNKKNEAKTFTCNADTKVDLGKKEAGKLADLKTGDKVKVTYTLSGETATAQKIKLVTDKKEKAPEAPAAK